MSEEAPKKRGRPRKVVVEESSVEITEPVKKTAAKKKINASEVAPKPRTKATKTKSVETVEIEATSPKRGRKSKAIEPQGAALEESVITGAHELVNAQVSSPAPVETISNAKITPANSEILSQVRELEASKLQPATQPLNSDTKPLSYHPTAPLSSPAASKPKSPLKQAAASTSKVSSTSSTPKAVPPKSTTPPKPSTTTRQSAPPSVAAVPPSTSKEAQKAPPTPQASSTPSTSSPKEAKSKPLPNPYAPPSRPPLSQMNAQIVSNLTSRAGARPSGGAPGAKPLPPNYKSAARSVTIAIVALPIAIVTSYFLWERLVMGQERKHLVRDPMPPLAEKQDGISKANGGSLDGK